MKKRNSFSHLLRWSLVIVLDVLLLGIILLAFAYKHHGKDYLLARNAQRIDTSIAVATEPMPTGETTIPSTSSEAIESTPPEETTVVQDTRTPWQIKFADKFTEEIVVTDNSYSSPNISITIETVCEVIDDEPVTYYIADIYVSSLACFKTYCSNNELKPYGTQRALQMDLDSGAILAISGDYYKIQENSYTMRNGEFYSRKNPQCDICVLYSDGTMATYKRGSYKKSEIEEKNPVQIWNFGPALLDENADLPERYNSSSGIQGMHPRSAIGYYEPGHYVFVCVDGRQEHSTGIRIRHLAKIFKDLGCKQAYNLDGGASSVMTFQDRNYNCPKNERPISDIIIVVEP